MSREQQIKTIETFLGTLKALPPTQHQEQITAFCAREGIELILPQSTYSFDSALTGYLYLLKAEDFEEKMLIPARKSFCEIFWKQYTGQQGEVASARATLAALRAQYLDLLKNGSNHHNIQCHVHYLSEKYFYELGDIETSEAIARQASLKKDFYKFTQEFPLQSDFLLCMIQSNYIQKFAQDLLYGKESETIVQNKKCSSEDPTSLLDRMAGLFFQDRKQHYQQTRQLTEKTITQGQQTIHRCLNRLASAEAGQFVHVLRVLNHMGKTNDRCYLDLTYETVLKHAQNSLKEHSTPQESTSIKL